jgi:putative endonuclease
MFYTYILLNGKKNKYYYGSTGNLNDRLKEHNNGKVKFTKAFRPWNIIYFEEYLTRSEAYRRELYFKSIEGRNWLKSNKII